MLRFQEHGFAALQPAPECMNGVNVNSKPPPERVISSPASLPSLSLRSENARTFGPVRFAALAGR